MSYTDDRYPGISIRYAHELDDAAAQQSLAAQNETLRRQIRAGHRYGRWMFTWGFVYGIIFSFVVVRLLS